MNKKFLIPIMIEEDTKVKLSSLNALDNAMDAFIIYDAFISKIDSMVEHENFSDTEGREIKELMNKLIMISSTAFSLPTSLKEKINELEKILRKKDSIKLASTVNRTLKEANKEKVKKIKKTTDKLNALVIKFFKITLNEPYLIYYRKESLNKIFIHIIDVLTFIKMVELEKLNVKYQGIINDNEKEINKEELELILKQINLLKRELLNFNTFDIDNILLYLDELNKIYEELLINEMTILSKNNPDFLISEYVKIYYELMIAKLDNDEEKFQNMAFVYNRLNRFIIEDKIHLPKDYLKELQENGLRIAIQGLQEKIKISYEQSDANTYIKILSRR